MAYLMTHFWPGGTEEQYQSMLAAVHPAEGLPEGQTSHVAGPTDRRVSDFGHLGLQGAQRAVHERNASARAPRSMADSRAHPRSALAEVAHLETA